MKSPFPGMDPYLEAYWGDVHTRMMTYLSDELRESLPKELVARIQVDPISLDHDVPPQRSIRIISAADNYLVTTIEVLSPRNKARSQAVLEFRKKQDAILAAGVNLVEIDLLRGGQYAMAMPKMRIKKAYWDAYKIVVQRHLVRDSLEFYPVALDQRLPAIRVPLRVTDADAVLDLQKVMSKVYEQSGYDSINYNGPPHPPLDEKFDSWADALLKKSGRRKL
jgi:hypothetical protein